MKIKHIYSFTIGWLFLYCGNQITNILAYICLPRFLQNCDPVIKRYVFSLKLRKFFNAFQIFRLQCSNVMLNFKVTFLEFRFKRRQGASLDSSFRYCINGFLRSEEHTSELQSRQY